MAKEISKDLELYFDTVIPEELKQNTPLLYDSMMIFLDYVQDTYDVGKEPHRLIDVLTTEEQDWDNVDGDLLRNEFLNVYLGNLSSALYQATNDYDLNNKLTDILEAYNLTLAPQALSDVIDYEKIISSKALTQSKGLFKSYYYIFDIIKELNIVKTLSTFNDYFLNISEDPDGEPFKYYVETSVSSMVFQKIVKRLVHPVGFHAFYSALLSLIFEENYSFALYYKEITLDLDITTNATRYQQILKNVKFNTEKDQYDYYERTVIYEGQYTLTTEVHFENETILLENSIGQLTEYSLEKLIYLPSGALEVYYNNGDFRTIIKERIIFVPSYEFEFKPKVSEYKYDTTYDTHFETPNHDFYHVNDSTFNISEFDIGGQPFDTYMATYNDESDYDKVYTEEDALFSNPIINGNFSDRFSFFHTGHHYERTHRDNLHEDDFITIGNKWRRLLVYKNRTEDFLHEILDEQDSYFLAEEMETTVEDCVIDTNTVLNEIVDELVEHVTGGNYLIEPDFCNHEIFFEDAGSFLIGEFDIGDNDIPDFIGLQYKDINNYYKDELVVGNIDELFHTIVEDIVGETSVRKSLEGNNFIRIGDDTFRRFVILKQRTDVGLSDESLANTIIVGETFTIGDPIVPKYIGIIPLFFIETHGYMADTYEWTAIGNDVLEEFDATTVFIEEFDVDDGVAMNISGGLVDAYVLPANPDLIVDNTNTFLAEIVPDATDDLYCLYDQLMTETVNLGCELVTTSQPDFGNEIYGLDALTSESYMYAQNSIFIEEFEVTDLITLIFSGSLDEDFTNVEENLVPITMPTFDETYYELSEEYLALSNTVYNEDFTNTEESTLVETYEVLYFIGYNYLKYDSPISYIGTPENTVLIGADDFDIGIVHYIGTLEDTRLIGETELFEEMTL